MSLKPEKWALCCPGPSLAKYSVLKALNEFDPDFIVAVNGAILYALDFDYWAVQDIEVFTHIIDHVPQAVMHNEDLTLWIPDRWEEDIPKDYPRYNVYFLDIYREAFASALVADFNDSMPFCRHINWREFTVLTALGLTIKRGARVIRLYGADMAGTGYFSKGLQNERTIHNEKRWIREMEAFEAIRKEAKNHGIEISREDI